MNIRHLDRYIIALLAIIAGTAFLILVTGAPGRAEEAPQHTGYYFYAADDYTHQTLFTVKDGNTLADPIDTATLPCGSWSVQADVVPVTQDFPGHLDPTATPLHPIASAHYLGVSIAACPTSTPTPTPTTPPKHTHNPPAPHHHPTLHKPTIGTPPVHHAVSTGKTLAYTGLPETNARVGLAIAGGILGFGVPLLWLGIRRNKRAKMEQEEQEAH